MKLSNRIFAAGVGVMSGIALSLMLLWTFPTPHATAQNNIPAWNPDPCFSWAVAKSSAVINQSSATTTQLVALTAGKQIYVCAFLIDIQGSATSVGSAQFESGTGSNCASNIVALTGVMPGNITASVPTVIAAPSDGTEFTVPAANELCIVSAGTTVGITGYVSYVIQ